MRMVGFEHELHEFHEYFLAHGWTRIYRADVIFEHELHEFHESFWAHGRTRIFTMRTIGYHKDTQEADKLVLPALGGDRGGR